ncbi:hypothetical protein HN911_13370 [Candidatus Bathyarchaeota archaeon]|jgi:hypothetical protein|nr:hypothetical protein [Candidatus Bathyarchaeota archaeon]
MSTSRSLVVSAEAVSISDSPKGGMIVKITNPSTTELTKLIRDAARLLHFRLEQERGGKKEV